MCMMTGRLSIYFNSIKVRLEQRCSPLVLYPITDFNSIKVRLELRLTVLRNLSLVNFNSIKVRLERACRKLIRIRQIKFQFHKGAIRTRDDIIPQRILQISIP